MLRIALVFFIFFSHQLAAQTREDTNQILKAGVFPADLVEKNIYTGKKIPFNGIIVYDQRFDSSKLGYIRKGGGGSDYLKAQAETDWSTMLNTYFRHGLDPASPFKLVLVIRSFWMQTGILDEIVDKNVITKQALLFGRNDVGGVCHTAIDAFIQSDSLVALFKIEDVFFGLEKFKGNKLDKWFFLPFDSIGSRSSAVDPASLMTKRRKISLNELLSHYKKRFVIPVLQNTPKKGIYRSFEDFKNNTPYSALFRIKRSKVTDELYILGNNEESLLTDFWGACDDHGLYIKVGYSICTAVRQENTFEIHGAKHVSNYHNNPQPGQLLRVNSMALDRKILQLDMETGKFY